MIRQSGLKYWIVWSCFLLLELRPFELWIYFSVQCAFTILQKSYSIFLNLVLCTTKELRFHLVCMDSTGHLKICTRDKHITSNGTLGPGQCQSCLCFSIPNSHSSHVSLNSSICQNSHVGWGYRAEWHSRGVLFTPCSLNSIPITNNHLLEWKKNCSRSVTAQLYHWKHHPASLPTQSPQSLFVSLFSFFTHQL